MKLIPSMYLLFISSLNYVNTGVIVIDICTILNLNSNINIERECKQFFENQIIKIINNSKSAYYME